MAKSSMAYLFKGSMPQGIWLLVAFPETKAVPSFLALQRIKVVWVHVQIKGKGKNKREREREREREISLPSLRFGCQWGVIVVEVETKRGCVCWREESKSKRKEAMGVRELQSKVEVCIVWELGILWTIIHDNSADGAVVRVHTWSVLLFREAEERGQP